MAETMLIYRLEDLSVNYFVRELFEDFPNVTIVDEFPKQVLAIPTISVVNGKLIEEEFELGSPDTVRIRRWFIDVFAVNKSQRDDFAYRILDLSKQGIAVYDYNQGFPPLVSPTVINHLGVLSRSYEPIDVITQLNEKLYYRGQIILVTTNDKV